MECVIFIGAQACGKSSFYRARYFRSHLRINLDMLKTRHREWRLLALCLEMQLPCVIDNTNPRRSDRARYIAPARAAGYRIVGCRFESPLQDCLRRNAARAEDERIPERGLRSTFGRIEQPAWSEGFDALYRVRPDDAAGFAVEPEPG